MTVEVPIIGAGFGGLVGLVIAKFIAKLEARQLAVNNPDLAQNSVYRLQRDQALGIIGCALSVICALFGAASAILIQNIASSFLR